ncbi:MAG: transglycosylase SLT domain-containing protein [Gemmatimonadota bacterium]
MNRRSILVLVGVASAIIVAALLMGRGGMDGAPVRPAEARPVEVVQLDDAPGRTAPVPEEIAAFLEEGRAWRAARALRSYIAELPNPDAETILLAARSEAQSGGWRAAREYLEGREWLDTTWEGEGWYWLARAREQGGDDREAVEAYDRFLALRRDDNSATTVVAELRRGLTLLRLGDGAAGAGVLDGVRTRVPQIGDWMRVLSAEALAESGDTAAARMAVDGLTADAGMRHRGRMALVDAYDSAGDRAGAVRVALSLRDAGGSAAQRAELTAEAGRLALAAGDDDVARQALRAAMDAAPGSAAGRSAATLMLELPGLTAEERLAIAEIHARHGNAARAVEGFRIALDSGLGSTERQREIRLSLGRALFSAGESSRAETVLRPLFDAPPALAREALLLTGRSQYRRGDQQQAFETFRILADRFPGSVEGSEGLFLVADLSHDDGRLAQAGATYRQVASDFRGTDRAGLSLMRLSGMRYLARDFTGAAALWEEYRSTYPNGERWLQSTYWAARSYDALGDSAAAEALYDSTRNRDPLSYYALLGSERLGQPYWPIPMSTAPGPDAAAEERVSGWIAAVDVLREAGLHAEANAEAQRIAELAGDDPTLLYPLAESLNERGYALRGIPLGQRIQRASSEMNPRLLRILYPLPYRDLVVAEAREQGLDPFVVAALTRQESLFTARISSPVGARGLMQIMPETGSALARGVGISEWDAELLFNPEINVHLGTIYLAEQMRRYDGSLPSVFSAYNAGPHRIDAWSDFPEYGDEELFTERIPYRETRDYVKILTRNIAIYRGLYGG